MALRAFWLVLDRSGLVLMPYSAGHPQGLVVRRWAGPHSALHGKDAASRVLIVVLERSGLVLMPYSAGHPQGLVVRRWAGPHSALHGEDTSRVLIGSWAVWISVNALLSRSPPGSSCSKVGWTSLSATWWRYLARSDWFLTGLLVLMPYSAGHPLGLVVRRWAGPHSALHGEDTSRVLIGSWAVWISVNAQRVNALRSRRPGCAEWRISTCTVLLSFLDKIPCNKTLINLSIHALTSLSVVRSLQHGHSLIFPVQTSFSVNK